MELPRQEESWVEQASSTESLDLLVREYGEWLNTEPDVSQRRPWEPSARKLVSSALVFPLFKTISGSHSLLCLGHVPWIVFIVTVDGRGELRNNTESWRGEEMAKAVGRLFPWFGFSLSSLFCMPGRWVKIQEETSMHMGFPSPPLSFFFSLSVCLM